MITGDIGYSNPLIIEARFISQAKDEILADIENSFGLGQVEQLDLVGMLGNLKPKGGENEH